MFGGLLIVSNTDTHCGFLVKKSHLPNKFNKD